MKKKLQATNRILQKKKLILCNYRLEEVRNFHQLFLNCPSALRFKRRYLKLRNFWFRFKLFGVSCHLKRQKTPRSFTAHVINDPFVIESTVCMNPRVKDNPMLLNSLLR